jgi:cation transport ATPase
MSMYLNASILAGNTHMAASINIVANTDGKKTEVNQLIELIAELNRVKADLKDELDKVNADAERLRALNVSHR